MCSILSVKQAVFMIQSDNEEKTLEACKANTNAISTYIFALHLIYQYGKHVYFAQKNKNKENTSHESVCGLVYIFILIASLCCLY